MCLIEKIKQIKHDKELKKFMEQRNILKQRIEQGMVYWMMHGLEKFQRTGSKTLFIDKYNYGNRNDVLYYKPIMEGLDALHIYDFECTLMSYFNKHFPNNRFAYLVTKCADDITYVEVMCGFSPRYCQYKKSPIIGLNEGIEYLFSDIRLCGGLITDEKAIKDEIYHAERYEVKKQVRSKVLEWYHKNDFDKYGTKEFNLEYSILPKMNDINPLDLLLGTYFVTLSDFDEILLEVFNEEIDTHECALMILMYDYEKDGSFKECVSVNKDFIEKGRDGGPYICRICLVKKDSPDYERFKVNGSFERECFYGVFQDTIDRTDETGQSKDMCKEDSHTNIEIQEPIIGIIIANFPD